MSKTPVNAPCPCGSGRKFKHCHGMARPALASAADRELDQQLDLYQEAETRLGVLLQQTLDPLCRALPSFLHAIGLDGLDEQVMPAIGPPILEYAHYDHRWNAAGDTVVFKAMAAYSHRFDARQRALVSSRTQAPLSLLRICAVDPGVGIEVQDLLLARAPFRIRERAGSRDMRVGDILFGRAGWLANLKVFRLYGTGGWLIDPRFELEILQEREARRPAGYENAAALSADALHWVCWYAHWCERQLRPPQVLAPDGEPLEVHTLYFDVIDMQATLMKLAELSGDTPEAFADRATISEEVIEVAWLGGPAKTTAFPDAPVGLQTSVDGRTILGYFKLPPGKLELITLSTASADRAKVQLVNALSGAARYRTRRRKDMAKLAADRATTPPVPATLSPDDEAGIVEPMLMNHYRSWLDSGVPALAGLTPREAWRRPDRRSHVEVLLRGLESGPFTLPPRVLAMLKTELAKS